MPCDAQIEYDVGITYFNVRVLYVNADNPCDGVIPAPFDYNVYAYKLGEGPPTDPPSLDVKLGERLGLKNGEGCGFRLPCGNYAWIVFGTRVLTWPGDPWDFSTRTAMSGTANVTPESTYFGYLKFHLSGA